MLRYVREIHLRRNRINAMSITDLFIEGSDHEALRDDIALCHGDSRDALRAIKDAAIDCVITDPPYFIDGMGDSWNTDELNKKKSRAGVVGALPIGMKFDPKQGVELQGFIAEVSAEIFRILKPGGFYLSFSQGRLYHRMAIAIEEAGFEIRDMLVWQREGQAKAFTQDHFVRKMDIPEDEKERIIAKLGGRKTPQLKGQSEPIVLAQKPKDGTFVSNWMEWGVGLIDTTASLDGKFPGTVMHVEKPKGKDREVPHLTMKPVPLVSHLIRVFVPEEGVVLDPFLGSGTTAVSALETGRKCVGIELDDGYYAAAKDRIEKRLAR